MTGWIERRRRETEERYRRLDEVLDRMAAEEDPGPLQRRQRRSSIMTSTTHPETTMVAPQGQPTIVITREFDAPPDRVYRAHTDPQLVQQWLGPRRLTMEIDEYDIVRGGSYRYRHIDEDGTVYGFWGVVHDARPGELHHPDLRLRRRRGHPLLRQDDAGGAAGRAHAGPDRLGGPRPSSPGTPSCPVAWRAA